MRAEAELYSGPVFVFIFETGSHISSLSPTPWVAEDVLELLILQPPLPTSQGLNPELVQARQEPLPPEPHLKKKKTALWLGNPDLSQQGPFSLGNYLILRLRTFTRKAGEEGICQETQNSKTTVFTNDGPERNT